VTRRPALQDMAAIVMLLVRKTRTVVELATLADVAETTVRDVLRALEVEGLVRRDDVPPGPGRVGEPGYVWTWTGGSA
jgi:predicted ArsR family transcriptional regulator